MATSDERNMVAKTALRYGLSNEQLKRLTANCIHGATVGDIVCALMRACEKEDRKKAIASKIKEGA